MLNFGERDYFSPISPVTAGYRCSYLQMIFLMFQLSEILRGWRILLSIHSAGYRRRVNTLTGRSTTGPSRPLGSSGVSL
jgi:hypothetical protein